MRSNLSDSRFDQLLKPHFGETCAAKALHALRCRALPAWDAYIRERQAPERRPGDTPGEVYCRFLCQVRDHILELKEDVERMNYCLADVPKLINRLDDRYDVSLVKIVDEYYWTTITLGHKVPDLNQLEEWLRWLRDSSS